MGIFASYLDVVFGYDGPGCEQCRGKGWLESALCIPQYHTHNLTCTFPCPCGYDPADEEEEPVEIVQWHRDEDWTPTTPQVNGDVHLMNSAMPLSPVQRLRKRLQSDRIVQTAHKGLVTSDVAVKGVCEETGTVAWVPPYLAGAVVDFDPRLKTLVLEYTFMTSTVHIIFTDCAEFRFAFPFDDTFDTADLMLSDTWW